MIEAKVVKDSISDHGVRLLTMKLRMHRYVLAEFNTHRAFSRNASSSRAVPTTKLLEEVRSNALRAAPVSWGQNQKGMQAGEELKGDSRKLVEEVWSHAAADAAYHAERLMKRGAHKQVCNRILEPFLFVNVIVTATEYQNFFGLRLDKAAHSLRRCGPCTTSPSPCALAMASGTYRSSIVKTLKRCGHVPRFLIFQMTLTRRSRSPSLVVQGFHTRATRPARGPRSRRT